MAARLASILIALVLGGLVAVPGAYGDGDPASDTLLGENVFYPYSPPVSGSVQKRLDSETAAARRAGFPIKVALIAAPTDLGVIPGLFGKPQKYADFLDQEISFQGKQQLLVVMAAGYGIQGITGPARLAASALPAPGGKTSTDLAQAALVAVAKLAAASGHPPKGVPGSGKSPAAGGGSSNTPIVIGLAAAAALVAAALVVLRRRQAVRPSP